MRRFPHGGEVLGASPAHPLLAPVLRPEMVLSRQQALLDLQAIQRIPGLAGYWPSDPAYAYQDSAGYTPANVGGVVGQVRDISNATTPVARRNLLTYSEQLDNAAWGRFETTISANDTIAPDGTTTADKIVGSTTYSQHYLEQPGLPTTNGTYTYSLYVKDGGSPTFVATVVHLGLGNNTSNIVFSVTGGVVAYSSGATAQVVSGSVQVTPVDNGFYRVQFAYTLSGTVTGHWARISAKQTSSYAGDGTSGIYIWGAQLEVGSEATPYQKIVTGTGDVFAPGNHAYQQTTANKPYLRKTPTSNVYWLDANTANSAITATLGNLGSACTVAKAGAEGVTFTEGVTISSTYNIAPAFGFNGDVAIFNRALTVTEKALLTRYMARGVPLYQTNVNAYPQMRNVVPNTELQTDYSGITSLQGAWRYSPITAMPLINIAACQTFYYSWGYCALLTDFPVGFFDSMTSGSLFGDCFNNTWLGCVSLTLPSLQNIVVSIAASGKNATTGNKNISLDGSPSLASVQADSVFMTAVGTLKSRSWVPIYKGTTL